jgi:hypothetical protein
MVEYPISNLGIAWDHCWEAWWGKARPTQTNFVIPALSSRCEFDSSACVCVHQVWEVWPPTIGDIFQHRESTVPKYHDLTLRTLNSFSLVSHNLTNSSSSSWQMPFLMSRS